MSKYQAPREVIEKAIDVLNEALEADPRAVDRIMHTKFQVNDELAKHWSIQCGRFEADGNLTYVRPLGLINGLFGVDADDWGFIAMEFWADGSIRRFQYLERDVRQ